MNKRAAVPYSLLNVYSALDSLKDALNQSKDSLNDIEEFDEFCELLNKLTESATKIQDKVLHKIANGK